jgi:hypothetical protein
MSLIGVMLLYLWSVIGAFTFCNTDELERYNNRGEPRSSFNFGGEVPNVASS